MEFSNSIQSETETEYTITGGSWNKEYQVVLENTTLYHVKNESPTPEKPHLTFHAGNSADGSIVGVAKSVRFSSDIQITLSTGADGDDAYSDVDSISKMKTTPTSTKISKKGLMSTRYAFEFEIAHQTRTLSWKNSEMMDAHGPLQSLKLVDEGNKVLACFFPGGTRLKPDGSLLVFEDLGELFTLVTLITALALREKLRRSVNGGYGQRPPLVGASVC